MLYALREVDSLTSTCRAISAFYEFCFEKGLDLKGLKHDGAPSGFIFSVKQEINNLHLAINVFPLQIEHATKFGTTISLGNLPDSRGQIIELSYGWENPTFWARKVYIKNASDLWMPERLPKSENGIEQNEISYPEIPRSFNYMVCRMMGKPIQIFNKE